MHVEPTTSDQSQNLPIPRLIRSSVKTSEADFAAFRDAILRNFTETMDGTGEERRPAVIGNILQSAVVLGAVGPGRDWAGIAAFAVSAAISLLSLLNLAMSPVSTLLTQGRNWAALVGLVLGLALMLFVWLTREKRLARRRALKTLTRALERFVATPEEVRQSFDLFHPDVVRVVKRWFDPERIVTEHLGRLIR